jgi:hypothetical protein
MHRFRFGSLIALCCVLLLAAPPSSAQEPTDRVEINPISSAGWNQLWDSAMAKSQGRARPDGRVWVVEVPSERAVYFFTTSLHPAHPSVVRRGRVEGDKESYVKTTAWTASPPEPFREWLAALLKPRQK